MVPVENSKMTMDVDNIKYRKALFNEISTLVDYRIEFLKEIQGEQDIIKENNLRKELNDYFEYALNDNSFIAWLAEFNDKPIAFGGMVIQRIPGNFNLIKGTEGYILNMYTIPAYRKKGVCAVILKKLMDEARELKLNRVYLHASPDGIKLYKSKGFAETELPELEFKFLDI